MSSCPGDGRCGMTLCSHVLLCTLCREKARDCRCVSVTVNHEPAARNMALGISAGPAGILPREGYLPRRTPEPLPLLTRRGRR